MSGQRAAGKAASGAQPADRSALMMRHREAAARRDAAPLDGVEYRAAAQEIAQIEIAISSLEEPRTNDL